MMTGHTRRTIWHMLSALALVGAGVLFGAGFGGGAQAQADETPATTGQEQHCCTVNVTREQVIPSVAVADDGFAVVGGADGAYYVVDEKGCAFEVRLDERHVLLWRTIPPQ